MIKKILSLIRQDFILTVRNGFLWVMIGLMAVMVLAINLLPQEAQSPARTLILDESPGQVLKNTLLAQGASTNNFADSLESVSNMVATNRFITGIVLRGDVNAPRFTLIYQDIRNQQTINTYQLVMDQLIRQIKGDSVSVDTTLLRTVPKPQPLNLKALPVLLVFEVMILGFLLVAVMVFAEKDEGSIKAYRVSPGGLLTYMLSKTIVFTLISLLYGLPIIILTVGFTINYAQILAVMTLSIVLFTLLGLGVAVYFQNISEWFFMGVLILIVNILAQISYMFPGFAPGWIRWLPSYPVLFGIQEIINPSGKQGFLQPILLQLGSYTLLVAVFTTLSVKAKLFKEGR